MQKSSFCRSRTGEHRHFSFFLFLVLSLVVAARRTAASEEHVKRATVLPETSAADRSPGGDEETETVDGRRMYAVRIKEPIVVDGLLAESAWEEAEPATDFLQREPLEGHAASERTEVRILYDDTHLYLGFKLYDSEPDKIIATDQRRDSRLRSDDTIAVILDTFHDHRNGFLFRTNPLGTREDTLLRNESDINREWNEDWAAAAQITADGWEAEMAIPFRVLRYRTGNHVWGIDFRREIRRKNEDVYWSNYKQDFRFNQVSQAGHLLGLKDLRLTNRVRIKPFATTGGRDQNLTDHPENEQLSDAGIQDAKFQLRPGLVLDGTVNTDFSETKIDTAQVNLTRFSLFFPEQREFFLESNNNFRFGPGTQRRNRTPLALLYFSRRIGLDEDNQEVPLNAGGKLTGKLGGLTIGALHVVTGGTKTQAGDNFSVLRLQKDLFSRSRAGVLVTNRTGGGTENRVIGTDLNFTFYQNLDISGWAARSTDSEIEGDRWAGQGLVRWNSDRWTFSADVLRIAPDFRADLGFILRDDIVRQTYRAGWKPRPRIGWLRQLFVFGNYTQFTDLGGRLESSAKSLFVNFRMESGDSFFVNFTDAFERLDKPFEIDPKLTFPVGDHRFKSARVNFTFFNGRKVAGQIGANFGEFFSGTRKGLTLAPTVRFGQNIQASVAYNYNRIDDGPAGFATHLVNAGLSYSFNEKWLTNTVAQYSSVSQVLTLFSQLDHIYRPNDDIFLIYEQREAFGGEFTGKKDHRFVFKMTYSLDF